MTPKLSWTDCLPLFNNDIKGFCCLVLWPENPRNPLFHYVVLFFILLLFLELKKKKKKTILNVFNTDHFFESA